MREKQEKRVREESKKCGERENEGREGEKRAREKSARRERRECRKRGK